VGGNVKSDPERRTLQRAGAKVDANVLLALERTLLAWVRTALAFMGFGFVVGRFGLFLEQSAAMAAEDVDVSRWLGTALVTLGVVVQALALVDYRRQVERVKRGEVMLPERWSPVVVLSALLVAVGAGMAVYLAAL
jgi:putative membrane protein